MSETPKAKTTAKKPATKKAVIAFQDNHDVIDSNGMIGPKTWSELAKFM
jgi:peptidoglycan hydrolase-like protein with peptidoglycan-binding domain